MTLSAAGVAALAARCRSARTGWGVVILLCGAFLVEVYPYRLPVEPRPYEVSRLDRAIPRVWQDERRAPMGPRRPGGLPPPMRAAALRKAACAGGAAPDGGWEIMGALRCGVAPGQEAAE